MSFLAVNIIAIVLFSLGSVVALLFSIRLSRKTNLIRRQKQKSFKPYKRIVNPG